MKKTALTAALCLIGFTAQAEDITNPFYMPLKQKSFLETRAEYSHSKDTGLFHSDTTDIGSVLAEYKFGLSDTFSFVGYLGNYGLSSEDKNYGVWGVGAMKMFYIEGNPELLFQAGVSYKQYKGGKRSIDVIARLGYDAGATFLPYMELKVDTPVEWGKERNESVIGLRLAGYSMIQEKIGIKVGLDFDYQHEGINKQEFSLFAEVDYILSPTTSIGVTGSYLLHDTYNGDAHIDSDAFSVGASLKFAF